jgi:hypothetical protein
VRVGQASTLPLLTAALALGWSPGHALAQDPFDLRLYALGLAAHVGKSDYGPASSQQLARLRIIPGFRGGPLSVDVAWEHLVVRQRGNPAGSGFLPGTATGEGTDWLDLGGTIHSGADSRWTHRLDRLSLSWEGDAFAVTVGRQTISWATTLFLTPADPFSPFDPSEPFREYRGGVDAVRLRAFPGPFTELEVVVRGAGTPDGDRATALARAQTSRGGWAFGGWGGWVYDRPAGALFASGAVGEYALRTEATLRDAEESGDAVLRAAVGLDRRFSIWRRDVYAIWELQYDGLGAASASKLLDIILSKPFSRGELQVLGQWASMLQATAQVHPLVAVDGLALASLGDGSVLLSPGISWSASASASVRIGAFLGIGDAGWRDGAPGSEYGTLPNVVYASLSWFF